MAYLDVDDTIRKTHGYAKQATGYGYSGVKGINAQLATLSTSTAAPVIAATRLRWGNAASAHGTPGLIAETVATAKRAGATGTITVRADSAYYNRDVVAAAETTGAHFSITARMDPAVTAAISRIPEENWTPIQYPNAIWEQDEDRWISDAEVAEIPYTAFTSRRKAEHVSARMIVRRVKRLNPSTAPAGQDELLAAYRHHAVFTDSPWRWSRSRPRTGTTRSPNKSSPILRTGRWRTCPRGVHRQRRLARVRGDGLQPHPRDRSHRLQSARTGPHRHDPRPAHPRAGADRQPRPEMAVAPAHALALADRLGEPLRPRPQERYRYRSRTRP